MKQIKIGKFILKNYGRPFIVAEVGINHDGSLKKAFKMIDIAKQSGCDAVKFQTFKANEIVQDKSLMFTYYSQKKKIKESMYRMFKRYEIKSRDWKKISDYCKNKKIIFFSTPQNYSDLQILLKLKIPAIKVGSDDFTNPFLIESYLKHKLPTILSTGMSTTNDIKRIINLKITSKSKLIFLLCTSEYPTNHKSVNINKFFNLKKILKKHLIGFSDHTLDNTASILAVANGCCFFEKHFTLNNNLKGPDHWFSLNPKQLNSWVASIRNAYNCMGSRKLSPTKKEKTNKNSFQRKIIAKKFIKKGARIQLNDIIMLRTKSKKALNAYDIKKIIKKKAKKNYPQGKPVI